MAITAGPNLNSVLSPTQTTLVNNYIDFTATATAGWAQQYLPDLMEKEAEVFGNRSISGFLSQVGAEEAMTADQVVWSEQGRLHLSYNCVVTTAASGLVTIGTDIDGNAAAGAHAIRLGDTVLVSKNGVTMQGYVSVEDTGGAVANITVLPYKAANMGTYFSDADVATIMVYGSEFGKGTVGQVKANEPQFTSFVNKPIIIKDYFQVNGSDASQIGWVEVSGEDGGAGGYLWYLKAEGDTRARFGDYLEMSMVESVKATPGTSVINTALGTATTATDLAGTEGLFAAIEDRGNETSGITGVNAATDLAEFDAILAEFDKQGAIEENMMFVNRATALAMDDMLASMNSYGAGGTSYGVFDNSEDMALNLGFSGFRRGSYDFYKSDWKYLNDKSTRGALLDTSGAIRGVMIPAGVSSVYDQQLGKNMKRPFLHVRYRASQSDDRRMKSWITGSVGGASTTDLDAMNVHYLSERCLITQGANNFMLLS
jgi:hypothetical protein